MKSINRLEKRRAWIDQSISVIESEIIRLKAWQHKLYEGEIVCTYCDAGIFLEIGHPNQDLMAAWIINTQEKANRVIYGLKRQRPLDRSTTRWGLGEPLNRIARSMCQYINTDICDFNLSKKEKNLGWLSHHPKMIKWQQSMHWRK